MSDLEALLAEVHTTRPAERRRYALSTLADASEPLMWNDALWVFDYETTRSLLASDKVHSDVDSLAARPDQNSLLFADGDVHARLRSVANAALQRSSPLRRVERLVDRELTGCFAGNEPVDIASVLAPRVALAVAADLLGLPGEDSEMFLATLSRLSGELDELARSRGAGAETPAGYDLLIYFARRRALWSSPALATIRTAADRGLITNSQALALPVVLLHAAFENTKNAIAAVVGSDQQQATSGNLEDVLAEASPASFVVRRLARSLDVGGECVPAGTLTYLSLEAANGQWRRRKANTPPLTWGAGHHRCLGMSIARAEVTRVREVLRSSFTVTGAAVREAGFLFSAPATGGLHASPL